MEMIRQYLLCVTTAAIICGIAGRLCLNKPVRLAVQLCSGMCMMLVLFSPLLKTDTSALLRQFRQIETEADQLTDQAQTQMQNQMAASISQQTAAYILDKAPLDADLTVEVETEPLDGYYCKPSRVTIVGKLSPDEQAELAQVIQQDLGLTGEQIQWKREST